MFSDFFIKSNLATVLFNALPGSSFRFIWESVPVAIANASLPKANHAITEDSMRGRLFLILKIAIFDYLVEKNNVFYSLLWNEHGHSHL